MKKLTVLLVIVLFTSKIGFAQLSGTYKIGETGSFQTIQEAIASLNSQGISDNVTFLIDPGIYVLNSSITDIKGATSSTKVTFTSSTNKADDVVLQNTSNDYYSYIIQIDSAKHIVFENLTFNPIGFYRGISISYGVDITVKDCKFFAEQPSRASNYLGGFITRLSNVDNQEDSMLIVYNNYFEKGNIGIYSDGDSYLSSVNIYNNKFIEQSYSGIYMNKANGEINIYDNYIYSTYEQIAYGIFTNNLDGQTVIKNNDIRLHHNIADYPCTGLYFSNSTPQLSTQVYNNIIYVEAPYTSYGILSANGSDINIQYNTVEIKSDESSAVFYFRYLSTNYSISNNSFVNFGDGYVFKTFDTQDITDDVKLFNYNNCYTSGNIYCRWAGNDYSLAEFRTATGNKFLNNISQVPASFIVTDNNYAYLNENSLIKGITDTIVTTDYNGNERPSEPTVGAIEYTDTTFDLLNSEWLIGCSTDTNYFDVTDITNSFLSYVWLFNTDTIATDTSSIKLSVHTSGWIKVFIKRNNLLLSDSAYITINPLPDISLGNDTAICNDEVISFTLEGTYVEYNWSTGATGRFIIVSEEGEYSVLVKDNNGCIGMDTVKLDILPSPELQLGNDTALCTGEVLTLSAGDSGISYLWNTKETTSTIDVDTSGMYFVTVFDERGCFSKDTVNVTFSICSGTDDTYALNKKIFIYPNPVKDVLKIESSDCNTKTHVSIISLTGEVLYEKELSGMQYFINVSEFPEGAYILRLKREAYTQNVKFIKQ